MGNRVNSVAFLTSTMGKDPLGKLMARGDELLVLLSANPTEMTRGHLNGIVDAVKIITFAKEADVKEALRNRWDLAHS
jgi:hypothetical protein